jgi:hypothetical protein
VHIAYLEVVTELDDETALDIRVCGHGRCKRERTPLQWYNGDEMREPDERDAQAVANALHRWSA